MRASIIILTFNQLEEGTRPCIESLYKYTDPNDFELICVDNDSHDGTPDFLKELEKKYNNVKIVLNDTNRGFAGGNNDGMRLATGDVLILLNNDTLLTPNWLRTLLSPMISDGSIGLIGPITNSAGNEQMVSIPDLNEANYVELAGKYVQRHAGYSFETQKLGFYCVAMTMNVFRTVGFLDEKFGIGMFEDDDYCVRVRKEGYRLVVNEGCFVFHKGSLSFKKIVDKEFQSLFARNREYFVTKHGEDWLFNDITMAFYRQMEREIRAQEALGQGLAPEVERVSVRLTGFRYLIENAKSIERRGLGTSQVTTSGEHWLRRAPSLFLDDFLLGDRRSRKLFMRRVYRKLRPLKEKEVIDNLGGIRRTDPFASVILIPDVPDFHGSEGRPSRSAKVLATAGQMVLYETKNQSTDTVEITEKVEEHLYLINRSVIGYLPHLARPEEVVLLATRASSILSIDPSFFSRVLLDLSNYDQKEIQINTNHFKSAMRGKAAIILVASNEIALDISRTFDQRVVVLEDGIEDHNIDKVMASLSTPSK